MNEPINELRQDNADEQYQTYLQAKKYFDILTRQDPKKEAALRQAIIDYEKSHEIK